MNYRDWERPFNTVLLENMLAFKDHNISLVQAIENILLSHSNILERQRQGFLRFNEGEVK